MIRSTKTNSFHLDREFITRNQRMLVKQYHADLEGSVTNIAVTVKKVPSALSGTKYVFEVHEGDLTGKAITKVTILLKPNELKRRTPREADQLAEKRFEQILLHLNQNLQPAISKRQKSTLLAKGIKFKAKSIGPFKQFVNELKTGIISNLCKKRLKLFETKTSPGILSQDSPSINALYQTLTKNPENPYPGYPKEPPPPGYFESKKNSS